MPKLETRTEKATIVDNDNFLISDYEDTMKSKKVLASTMKTFFLALAALTEKTAPVDADLLVINDSAESNAKKKLTFANLVTAVTALSSLTEKTTPVDADLFLLNDSAATFAKKKLTLANLRTALLTAVVFSQYNTETSLSNITGAGTLTLDVANGNCQKVALVGGTAGTVTIGNAITGTTSGKPFTLVLRVVHDVSGKNWTITFPGSQNYFHLGQDGDGAKNYTITGSATARYTLFSIYFDGTRKFVSYSPFTTNA